MNQDAISLYIQ